MKSILYLSIVIVASTGIIIPTFAEQIPSELTNPAVSNLSNTYRNDSLILSPQNDSVIETAKMNASLEARQINIGNTYLVLGDFTDTSTSIDYARAICRVGDVVIECGYQNPNAMFSPNDIVIVSGPFFNSPTQSYGYQVTIATKTGTIGSYQAYAYCFDNSP